DPSESEAGRKGLGWSTATQTKRVAARMAARAAARRRDVARTRCAALDFHFSASHKYLANLPARSGQPYWAAASRVAATEALSHGPAHNVAADHLSSDQCCATIQQAIHTGMMQVGTLMEFKSFSLAPMIGSSAPLANCARQRSMAAMNVFRSIAMRTARFAGRASMRSLK